MIYDYDDVQVDRLLEVLSSRGISRRQFEVMMWGSGTKRTIKDLEKSTSVKTLVKICSTVGCSAEELLTSSDNWKRYEQEGGRPVETGALTDLQIKIALQKLLDDKNAKIKRLEELNDRLFSAIEKGMITGQQNSEAKND